MVLSFIAVLLAWLMWFSIFIAQINPQVHAWAEHNCPIGFGDCAKEKAE